ncbi:topless-related protein 1-like isoform X1 [Iris pallida]|uniref:Topless-related protein 1-like isoform X1 n=1 Tax=Iris pallida TaxID=29817 RepID=A0AAX6H0P4_IRIPA|nr:topless-related protein 1-like isoform X1 [Iris pallida]KAJ6836978.1 topless-related protein 1-like isoform X1 [Iris pallida]
MTSLSRELVFLILQFLEEEKFKETVHKLEQESGFYFNMKHFEEAVLGGEWDEVEKYLSGFTKVDDNRYSMKIFFEIRKQKYLEALDKRDRSKAVDILVKDLKVFSAFNEDLFKEITQLLTLENFRENEQLSKYGDTKSARGVMLTELKKLIEANPKFREKLQFPNLKSSRLRTLINQSLNWQHQLCKNPRQNPDIKTLFYDHSCSQPNGGGRVPSPAPLMNVMPKAGGFPQMAPHGPFQPAAAPLPSSLAGWMANASNAAQMAHPLVSGTVSGAPLGLSVPPNTAALLKRPMTPPSSNPIVDYHSADSEHVHKRPRPMGISDEVGISSSHMPVGYPGIARSQYSTEELPKNVAVVLNQGSSVMSMDFHPSQPTILLVGTNVGDIAVWEVSSRERLAHRNFKVWDLQACSMLFQSALVKDPAISVTRVLWNPDGSQFGVAYSKHLVHLYNYNGREDLIQHLEIDAHVGGVNDIAFSQPNKQFCVVTCGDDKTIKVWDAVSGVVQYTFEGHEAAVYSICPHSKENIQFIFSTSLDGKIKAWLYDNGGSRVDYTAPGHSCTTMAYSADGTRLFSCGTSKEGDSDIVEWNESEGSVKRTYTGFRKRSAGVVQFDTIKNRFLAAGDEFVVKFWDMDNTNLLTTTDAEGGLPASPRIRFNKLGSLLAVSTSDNCIKVLANADGFQMLRSLENRYNSAPRSVSEAITKASAIGPLGSSSAMAGTSVAISDRSAPAPSIVGLQNGDSRSMVDVKPRIDESIEKSKIWKLTEISEPSQCCSLKLPDNLLATKVSRLIYTNSGMAVLALTSNAVHKLWKWQKTDRHTGKATALVSPQLWQPSSGILMTNEISDVNPEEAVHCFALSKNDSYVMSASGGKISLFNMMTFKTMTTFMPPPPAATFLAFHPQDNNIIAIGMDDSSIQIYNVRVDEVKSKLRGHQKRITGLAFSNALNVLVSSGADAQLCVWGTDGWDKQTSKFLQIPSGRVSGSLAETRVQFHHDQVTFLVVHETQLAIYEAAKLERLKQWTPREGSITHATYSCDSQLVYTSFTDGSVGIFSSALQLRCRISPTAYINSQPSSSVYPVVVAAHPSEPNQFAVGLTDGSVQVLEPLESDRKWGTDPPPESGSGGNASSSQPSGNPSSEQPSR